MDPPSDEQVQRFRDIKVKLLGCTTLPAIDRWRSMSADDIWLRVVSQVVVVGNAEPAEKLRTDQIRTGLSFNTLAALEENEAAKAIGKVLAKIGTRYVRSIHPENSPKVRALRYNLDFLRRFNSGPCGFVKYLSEMESSQERIGCLSQNFKYIKAKGARDFLTTGLGMATDVIALDSRVMGIVRLILPYLPANVTAGNYNEIEKFLIEHVCEPLKISAMEFDQLLFHNASAIQQLLGDTAVAFDQPSLTASGSPCCRASRQGVASRRRLR